MKYTTYYLGIDKFVFEFSENDIKDALIKVAKQSLIKLPDGGRWEFDWETINDDPDDMRHYDPGLIVKVTYRVQSEQEKK